jgi:hypothetical protein
MARLPGLLLERQAANCRLHKLHDTHDELEAPAQTKEGQEVG